MKTVVLKVATTCLFVFLPTDAFAQAVVVGQDGAFLGVVDRNSYNRKSICNQYGNYGNQVSPTSIFNQVGTYGSQVSNQGAYSEIAQYPPVLYKDGQPLGFVSKNRNLPNAIDPDSLYALAWGGS